MWNPDIDIVDGEQHRMFMRIAYDLAWLKSDDNSTKTGAAIVRDDRIVGVGWNHFKPGIIVTPELIADRMWKRNNITHAEDASIQDTIAYGVNPRGLAMYMPWVPCKPCAEKMVDAGISTLYSHKQLIIRSPDDWIPSLQDALDHLRANGVRHYMLDGELGGVQSRFRDVTWSP